MIPDAADPILEAVAALRADGAVVTPIGDELERWQVGDFLFSDLALWRLAASRGPVDADLVLWLPAHAANALLGMLIGPYRRTKPSIWSCPERLHLAIQRCSTGFHVAQATPGLVRPLPPAARALRAPWRDL